MPFEYIASLFRKYGRVLSTRSLLRLWREARYQARHGGEDPRRVVEVKLAHRSSARIRLRPATHDLAIVLEVFEDRVYQPALDALGEIGTMIDLGANIGLSCVYFSEQRPGVRILALEPDSANYELLRSNVRHGNGDGSCQTCQAAFWRDERTPLVVSSNEATDSADLFMTPSPEGASGPTVRGMTMETIVRESGFEQVDLLKVDIEGAEANLFCGSLEWLRRVRAIAIEFHRDARRESRFDEVMREHGFRIDSEGGHTVVAVRS